jgi:hypothetical protein
MAELPDPVGDYARDVIAGKISTGRLVRLARERHRRDRKNAEEQGWNFDLSEVDRALRFFEHLRHSKGEWANDPLKLEPWQVFIVGSLVGWKRADGMRRFRLAYVERRRSVWRRADGDRSGASGRARAAHRRGDRRRPGAARLCEWLRLLPVPYGFFGSARLAPGKLQ